MWHSLLGKWKELFFWLPIEELIQSRQKEYYDALGAALSSFPVNYTYSILSLTFPFYIKNTHLLILIRQFMQIAKTLIRRTEYIVFPASFHKH